MIKYYSQQIYLKLGFLAHSTKSESIVVIFFLSQNYIQRNLPLIWLGIIILKSVELVTFCQNWSCISCKNLISHMTYLFYSINNLIQLWIVATWYDIDSRKLTKLMLLQWTLGKGFIVSYLHKPPESQVYPIHLNIHRPNSLQSWYD